MGALFAFLGSLFAFPLLLLAKLGEGALSEVGRFLVRPFLFVAIIALSYFLIVGTFSFILELTPIRDVFAVIADTGGGRVVRYLFWLFALDVILAVLPAVISARFVIDRVTFPL